MAGNGEVCFKGVGSSPVAVYLPVRSDGDTLSFALPEGVYRAEIADGLGNRSAGEVTVAP
ncbi:hypothetical protein LJB68_06195 [bacterium 210820-DFI.6.52]|nr:hypothetical protein [bacterium 210820-DFI.6.52]